MAWFAQGMIFLIPIAGTIALFTFLSVVGWSEQRRREREAYYRYEFRKKLVEAGKMQASDVQDLVRFEYEVESWRNRQRKISAGVVLASVGLGLVFGLRFIDDPDVWMVGFIPGIMGLGLLLSGLLLRPREAPVPPLGAGPETSQGSPDQGSR